MTEIVAVLACLVLACLSVFQIALIAGAPIGMYAWGGAYKVLPSKLRISSAVAVILYSFFALIILNKTGAISVLPTAVIVDISTWIVTAYLFIGVIMNGVSKSRYERLVMTPTALVLAVLYLIVAVS
jgi:hypothetical protein